MTRTHLTILAVACLPLIGFAPTSKAQPTDSPRAVAIRVADRIVAETEFDFKPVLQPGEQEGFYVVDFFDTFGTADDALYYARSILVVDSAASDVAVSDLALAISHSSGDIRITLAGDDLYSGSSDTDGVVRHLDYALVRPDTTVPLNVPRGAHRLGIKFVPSGESAVVHLGLVHQSTELAHESTHLKAPGLSNPPDAVRFLVAGPFDAGIDGVETDAGPDSAWLDLSLDYVGLGERRVRWDIPRFHLIRDHPERLDYSDWRYFSGTFLDAMFAVSDRFGGLDYSDYIDRHLEFFLANRDLITREREDYNLIESAFGHYFRGSLLDDLGMQAVPYADRLLDLQLQGRCVDDRTDVTLVRDIAEYVYSEARRLEDGTFARLNPDSLTVWADDLFMGSIILIRAAELFDRPEYLAEAVRQVQLMHRHLNDPSSGLYWHGRFARTGEHSSSKWGRANGWTMMAKTELLLNLDPDDPGFEAVLEPFRSHSAALLAVQSEDGRWHQVLDNPNTYLETSATAMFVRAFAEGIRNGWLPRDDYLEAVRKGWDALAGQVRHDGMVEGIVRGTPIFYSDDEYDAHPTRLNDPRGLGAVLYAAVAVDRLNEWIGDD